MRRELWRVHLGRTAIVEFVCHSTARDARRLDLPDGCYQVCTAGGELLDSFERRGGEVLEWLPEEQEETELLETA